MKRDADYSKVTSEQLARPELPYDANKLYAEIWTTIRETDNISFKLLGFVPLVAGSGVSTLSLLLAEHKLLMLPVVLISLLGFLVTFGIYRWELRNIQTCRRLMKRAEFLETYFGLGHLAGREPAPALFGWPIGKTQAETLIYVASMIAWLIPVIVVLTKQNE